MPNARYNATVNSKARQYKLSLSLSPSKIKVKTINKLKLKTRYKVNKGLRIQDSGKSI